MEDEDYIPCDDCDFHCDAWEARYCCTLCQWTDEHPDCDSCDPWET